MADADFWTFLQFGLRHFGDEDMLALTDRLRSEVALLVGPLMTGDSDSCDELDPARTVAVLGAVEQFHAGTMRDLDDECRRLMPGSLQHVGRVIRDRPADYATVEANHA